MRQDELDVAKTQFRAVDRGHADDCANAVVVDQKCDQVFEQLAVALDVLERLPQSFKACLHDGLAARQRSAGGRRFGHPSQNGD